MTLAAERMAEIAREHAILRDFAHEATKLITLISGGGSEMFDREISDVFLADLPRCKERIDQNREQIEALYQAKCKAALRSEREAREKAEAERDDAYVYVGNLDCEYGRVKAERDAALSKLAKAREAFKIAKNHIVTLGGDRRSVPYGDAIQGFVLDQIDATLTEIGDE